jgi:transcriptional regulator with XRE-family HTH domain
MTTNSRGGFVKTAENAENDAEALRLRSEGLTYREIAQRLGINSSTAYRRVENALRAIPAHGVEEMRQLEGERLDKLHAALWERALEGDLSAIDRLLTISARRSKLYGLDAPTRQINELQSFSTAEISAEVRRLELLLMQDDAREVSR